ncbi:succinate-acetate transporter [Gammaproteobacteria bacterium]|nr:succinate-acetate transporter [Gammaproteobacteria bacterium]
MSINTNSVANPGPLGLAGFGMTTILLNLHNAGFFPIEGAIIAMGIFYGGISQVIAGIIEFKRNNTFGATAFTSYGFFWLTLVTIWILPSLGLAKTSSTFLAWYLLIWGVFTFFLFLGTLKSNRVVIFVFGSLVVLFALLALGNFTENNTIIKFAGWIGIICGSSAIYLAMAEVLESVYKRWVLPIGLIK